MRLWTFYPRLEEAAPCKKETISRDSHSYEDTTGVSLVIAGTPIEEMPHLANSAVDPARNSKVSIVLSRWLPILESPAGLIQEQRPQLPCGEEFYC
jgi:hypothetical protein